jgi:hypothetical protein
MYAAIISSLWIILIEISERKRWSGRPEYRKQGNIKIEVTSIKKYKGLDSIDLPHNIIKFQILVSIVMHPHTYNMSWISWLIEPLLDATKMLRSKDKT